MAAPGAGFIGENSIVGADGAIACGVALEAQAKKTGAVVRRLGSPDVRVPASPVLQAALLPKARAILSALTALVESCRAPSAASS